MISVKVVTLVMALAGVMPAKAANNPVPNYFSSFPSFLLDCHGTLSAVENCLLDHDRYRRMAARMQSFDAEAIKTLAHCANRGCPSLKRDAASACILTFIYAVVESIGVRQAMAAVGNKPCPDLSDQDIANILIEARKMVPDTSRRIRD